MGKNVVITGIKQIDFVEYEDAPLQANQVRIETLYSGISAGTELSAYRGSNPYLSKRWDKDQRVFVPGAQTSVSYPMSAWGYEESGRVSEVGPQVSKVNVGDLVCGAWGHRTHHVMTEDDAAARVMPAGLDPILGIFSRIGAIALNGVHDATTRVGETVAVFGLGTVGHIVAQLLKASGVRVIGVDLDPLRLDVACRAGAIDIAVDAREGGVAERIKGMTEDQGADVAIEASGAYPALHEAIRSVAYSSKVVAMGFYQGGGQALYLGEEFHHNRVNVVGSQIYGVNPELKYRWDDQRLAQTVLRLQSDGALKLRPLITHVVSFSDAAEAFRLCDIEADKAIQVVLSFT